MTESQATALKRERSRLLDAWRNAQGSNKMSILVMIDDIDAKLEKYKYSASVPATKKRFYR